MSCLRVIGVERKCADLGLRITKADVLKYGGDNRLVPEVQGPDVAKNPNLLNGRMICDDGNRKSRAVP